MTWDPLGYLRAVRDDTALGGMQKLVLTMLLSRSDAGGEAYPSVARLARDAGIGTATVRRALRELERAGWVRTRYAEGGSSFYRLAYPNHSERGSSQADCPTPITVIALPTQSERGPQSQRAATPITLIARTTQGTTQEEFDDDGASFGIRERAQRALAEPDWGLAARPSTWPEVRTVFAAWCAPWKLTLRLGDDPRRADLRAVLAALVEYSAEELVHCAASAARDALLARQRRPGPASFTLGVIGRLLVPAMIEGRVPLRLEPLPPVVPGAARAALAALGVRSELRPPANARAEDPASGVVRRAQMASGEAES